MKRALLSRLALLACAASASLFAALTPAQKELDLRIVAAEYAKLYAPYEWKRDTMGFDFYNLSPWIARARATKTDIEYYEVLGQYVASLQDSHASFSLFSSFTYATPVHADFYDGKAIIDNINRSQLPAAEFPFQVGDEVVLVGGRPVEELVAANMPLVTSANDWSRRRVALGRIFNGSQSNNPLAYRVGESVELTIRSRTTGAEAAYTVPVTRSGEPLAEGGTTPSPVFTARPQTSAASASNSAPDDYFPPWVSALAPMQLARTAVEPNAVLGFGNRPPFVLPAGFEQRLGRLTTDEYYSGTFPAGGARIGYIRIPTFTPRGTTATALRQFETEIQFFNQNTSGLIIDIMRNPGGNACYTEELLRRLIPGGFRSILFEIRASTVFAVAFQQAVDSLTAAGAPAELIARYQSFRDEVVAASQRPRGRTSPLPLCSDVPDRTAAQVVYSKPVILLADEFTASGGDFFAATIQDARRGPVFGFRTNGAGGTVQGRESGPYSEFYSQITLSLMVRANEVALPGYPVTRYVENTGVWPDIPYNYMSLDNLLSGGTQFRDAAVAALLNEISLTQ